jgi:hyperosmotically inducible periplasmic protein
MRYATILGAAVFASVAVVTAPTYVQSQSTGDKVEQKAEQAWQKTKDVTRDAKSEVNDSWLTAKTKIALFADERVKGRQVGVETVKGVVTLRGKVDSDEAKAAAASLAEGIEGVKSVRNDLQVVVPADRKAVDISDKDITSQVEDRLSKDPRLKKVDVRTDRGVVSLTGDVPGIGASARASEIAREVPSVRSVKNELTYDGARSNGSGPRSRSADGVTATQQALKEKGFDPGPIDGVMGLRTVSALKDYQKSENLAMTGRMDRDTAAKLGAKAEKRPSQ